MKLFESYVAEEQFVSELEATVIEHNLDVQVLVDEFLEAVIADEQDAVRREELLALYENIWNNIMQGVGSFARSTADAFSQGYNQDPQQAAQQKQQQMMLNALSQAYQTLNQAGLGNMFQQYFQQVAQNIQAPAVQAQVMPDPQQQPAGAKPPVADPWSAGLNNMASAQRRAQTPGGYDPKDMQNTFGIKPQQS